MASLHSKVYQATLREEHAMKRVRELEKYVLILPDLLTAVNYLSYKTILKMN